MIRNIEFADKRFGHFREVTKMVGRTLLQGVRHG